MECYDCESVLLNVKVSCNWKEITDRILIFVTLLQEIVQRILG
jgi:hypothetical protein